MNNQNDNQRNNNIGRPARYLTMERFERFRNNDFFHLKCQVATNKRLLWIILAGLIAAALLDRFFG